MRTKLESARDRPIAYYGDIGPLPYLSDFDSVSIHRVWTLFAWCRSSRQLLQCREMLSQLDRLGGAHDIYQVDARVVAQRSQVEGGCDCF